MGERTLPTVLYARSALPNFHQELSCNLLRSTHLGSSANPSFAETASSKGGTYHHPAFIVFAFLIERTPMSEVAR